MEFGSYLKANPIGILVPGAGAIFSDYDAVIPDLAFVSNERWDQVVTGEKFTGPLDLVIEILSAGNQNRQRDQSAKRGLYERYGAKEYWIVDPENREVLIFCLKGEALEEVSTVKGDDEITSPLLHGLRIRVSSIFNL